MGYAVKILSEQGKAWRAPDLPEHIPGGDMPGDRVQIGEGHIAKAGVIFPRLLKLLADCMEGNEHERAVVTVCGGSGVGKSEIASLLSFYLNQIGIGSYTLSGDNYPHRIPMYNDAERLRIFRQSAIRGLARENILTQERLELVRGFQKAGNDADPAHIADYDWYGSYIRNGREGLKAYLGSASEIDFEEIGEIVSQFKKGASHIWLKRMGREETELWYENKDFSDIKVLIVEWTHGNSDHYQGVDIPILLNSTPKETLEHRRSRNRDGGVDSPFTTMVLELEQDMLRAQAHKARLIVSKQGSLLTYEELQSLPDNGPMLNAYPDSIGGGLSDIVAFLDRPEMKGVFTSFYVLPSLFHTDLDRGFSVIDYSLNELLASEEDLKKLEGLGISLKLDFVLNHASVLSGQFQDILEKGEASRYRDFFIDWNRFWEGHGTMTEGGYILPDEELLTKMFFRKPGLPILMVRFPDGREVPYWNTFYQEVRYPEADARDLMKAAGLQYGVSQLLAKRLNEGLAAGMTPSEIVEGEAQSELHLTEAQRKAVVDITEAGRKYLGQMDLNIKSPLVWEFYEDTLKRLSEYGAKIVRLDAFAYAPKEPGEKNFLNEPGTWDVLQRVRGLADRYGLTLLPEIHAGYGEKNYEDIARKGYMTYDFFLPGLIIDALERGEGDMLKRWADELTEKGIRTVNMLGCHDGIPLLDLKGLIPEERIQAIIDTVVGRGGYVKDLHGQKNIYYQVNATYYSALGEDDRKMLMARAIQLFMPGKPQVWYLDLFAGKNDYEAVKRAGAGGHKEINRSNLSLEYVDKHMGDPVVQEQLRLLKFRAECPAFSFDSSIRVESEGQRMTFAWEKDGHRALLEADLKELTYKISERLRDK